MVTVRELTFNVLFKDKATKALKRADKQMNRVSKSTKRLRRGSERLERQQKSLKRTNEGLTASWRTFAGIAGIGFAINAMRNLGLEAFRLTADFEQTEISFETMLGSAERAAKVLMDLERFSLVTPFTPEEVIKAGQGLLAFGIEADEVVGTLGMLGDVAAAFKDTSLPDLGRIFGKVFTKGKAQTEELLQFAERGIPIIDVLATNLGVTGEEIFKMAEKGEISFDTLRGAFVSMTSEGGKFNNLMAKQSKSLTGLISTYQGFRGEIFKAFGRAALEPAKELVGLLIDMARETLAWLKVAENVEGLKQTFKDIADVLKLTLKLMAGVTRLTTKLSQFEKTAFGGAIRTAITGALPSPSEIVGKVARGSRVFSPRTAPNVTPPAGAAGPGAIVIPKLAENITIRANTHEEGRAAARGLLDELDASADKLKIQLATQ